MKLSLGLFSLFFSAYLLVTSARLFSVDDKIIFDVTKSMLAGGSFASSEPLSEREHFVEPWFYVEGADGQAYSKYGLGESLAILPLFVVGKAALPFLPPSWVEWFPPDFIPFKSPERTPDAERIENSVIPAFTSLLNPAVTALSCLLVFLLASRLGGSLPVALVVSAVFGFATAAFPYAKYSFQHPLVTVLTLASFFFLFSLRTGGARWRPALAGACLGFAMLTRYEAVVSVFAFAPYAWWVGGTIKDENSREPSPLPSPTSRGRTKGEGANSLPCPHAEASNTLPGAIKHGNATPADVLFPLPLQRERVRVRAPKGYLQSSHPCPLAHHQQWKWHDFSRLLPSPFAKGEGQGEGSLPQLQNSTRDQHEGTAAATSFEWKHLAGSVVGLGLFLLPVLLFGLMALWFNHVRFGSFTATGYVYEGFTADLRESVKGLLLSPGRSILLFSPPILLGLICLPRFIRRHTPEGLAVAALIAIYFVLDARWSGWEGGWAWGSRYPLPMLPFLILPIGVALQGRAMWPKVMLLALVLLSLPIQLLGVVTNFNDFYMERTIVQGMDFWSTVYDWEQSQIPGHWDLLTRGVVDLWFWHLLRNGAPLGLQAIMLFPLGLLTVSLILIGRGLGQGRARGLARTKGAEAIT